jgi:hypothetical protein
MKLSSSTTTREKKGRKRTDTDSPIMAPIHPGEMLLEDFLEPLGISQYRLAQALAFRPDGSVRSFMGVDGSALTRRCAFPDTSE